MTSSPHNPDDRDLLDFADAVSAGENPQPQTDLERTFLHVQHAMHGEHGAIPADLKQSTWEDVMSTLAITPETPVSNRTKRQQAIASPPRLSRPKRLQWTPMASIAAAVLVVLASIGIWRINTMPNESLPPLAPQVAGITSGNDIALVAATPEATAVADESGNISIPIVQHVDEQPMPGPVIWLTTTGDVMYDDGSGEVMTITTGAYQVTPQVTNVIKVLTKAPEKDMENKDGQQLEGYTATYHHLITGKTLVDDGTFSSYLGGPNTFGSLMVLTIADAPREWSVVNFETMESKSISELTGGIYPSSESITVATSDDHSTIAIGTSQYQTEGSAILNRQSGLPGEVAVISVDMSAPTWVVVPDGMTAVGNISLSPNGKSLAFISSESHTGGSSMTVAVMDVTTGEELVRTPTIGSTGTINLQWLNDSSAFVIVSGESVDKYALDGSEPVTLLESDGTVRQMPQPRGTDLMHLSVSTVELVTTAQEPETSQFVILDMVTGDTTTIDGMPWDMGSSYPVTMSTDLAPVPVSQDGSTAALAHPVTGELLPGFVADTYNPTRDPAFTPVAGEPLDWVQTVITARSAPVSLVALADGNVAVVTTSEDSFEARAVVIPKEMVDMQLSISTDGQFLLADASWEQLSENDAYLYIDLSDPNADWVQGEPGQRIDFVEFIKP